MAWWEDWEPKDPMDNVGRTVSVLGPDNKRRDKTIAKVKKHEDSLLSFIMNDGPQYFTEDGSQVWYGMDGVRWFEQ